MGDSAHQVSPFGARGANSGIQDADNLAWKLALVAEGRAGEALLDSYDAERVQAAEENILNSTRATDFITPKTAVSKMFRDAVLALAQTLPFARTVVNSGRLSVPCSYDGSALNGPDHPQMPARTRPGSPCPDAPLGQGWLLAELGHGFTLMGIGAKVPPLLSLCGLTVTGLSLGPTPELAARYLGAAPGAVYLVRPDQHVAARWESFDAAAVAQALARAIAKE
jgi:3-(3-hydroxy-phenyl)propionate hydroxylase